MAEWEVEAYLAEARKHASAASYDVQRLSADTEQRQALHNIVMTLDAILAAIDAALGHSPETTDGRR